MKAPEPQIKQKNPRSIQNGVTKKCSIYQKKTNKKKKNAIDINITQMMVGKQWVKR